jgi:hypothetical protein
MSNTRNSGTMVRLRNTLYNYRCAENPDEIDWDKASRIPIEELKKTPNFGAKSLELLLFMIERHKNDGME